MLKRNLTIIFLIVLLLNVLPITKVFAMDDSTEMALQKQVEKLQEQLDALTSSLTTCTIIVVLLAILFLLIAAWNSRNKAIANATNLDAMSNTIMKYALGMPQGTIRGILSIAIVLFFIGFAFIRPDHFIEPIKIIATTVIAFYFAKRSDDAMDIVRAVQGEPTSDRHSYKKAVDHAMASAKQLGADKNDKTKTDYKKAHELVKKGDVETDNTKAISQYSEALGLTSSFRDKLSE